MTNEPERGDQSTAAPAKRVHRSDRVDGGRRRCRELRDFQDSERTTGNEVTAGTLDLTANETKSITRTVTDGTSSNLPCSNLAETVEVDLSNDGSLASSHVEIDFHVQADEDNNGVASDGLIPGPESDSDPTGADGMAEYVRVEDLTYTRSDGTTEVFVPLGASDDGVTLADYELGAEVYDVNGNGWIDLDDLERLSDPETNEKGYDPFGDLDAPSGGTNTTFELILLGIAQAAGDPYHGDVVGTDIEFTLQQDSSQDATGTQTR